MATVSVDVAIFVLFCRLWAAHQIPYFSPDCLVCLVRKGCIGKKKTKKKQTKHCGKAAKHNCQNTAAWQTEATKLTQSCDCGGEQFWNPQRRGEGANYREGKHTSALDRVNCCLIKRICPGVIISSSEGRLGGCFLMLRVRRCPSSWVWPQQTSEASQVLLVA